MNNVKEITNETIDVALQYRKEAEDKLEQACKENKDKIVNAIIQLFNNLNNTANLITKIKTVVEVKAEDLQINIRKNNHRDNFIIDSIRYSNIASIKYSKFASSDTFNFFYYDKNDKEKFKYIISSTDKSFYDNIDDCDIPFLYNLLKKYADIFNRELLVMLDTYNEETATINKEIDEIKTLAEGL